MLSQAVNPFLPSWEYIPDGEPRIFGDRLYLFGSHDRFAGRKYCMNDYVVWSAPLKDLSSWTQHGVSYRKTQDPGNPRGRYAMWAPDVAQGADGRYYLYYGLEFVPRLSVAVADVPEGPYEFFGHVEYPDGNPLGGLAGDVFPFDPGVLVDDDGKTFLYFGFGPGGKSLPAWNIDRRKLLHEGAYVVELQADMRTIVGRPKLIVPVAEKTLGTGFEGHGFLEASSIRKIDRSYYFTYSSINGHELCYATSSHPDRDFRFAGVLISNADIGLEGRTRADALNYFANNHGGLVQVESDWFIFYHRHTNRAQVSRQAMAEPIKRTGSGEFLQAEMTSSGLHGGSLAGVGRYSAHIACVLRSADGAKFTPYLSLTRRGRHPYFTQSSPDRNSDGDQYVANMRDGAVAGFKYFDLQETRAIQIQSRKGSGRFEVSAELEGPIIATIPVSASTTISSTVPLPPDLSARSALYLRYRGRGAADLQAFTLIGDK